MKILERKLERGEITLLVESRNDLWHLYNILCKDDIVYARTYRRIRKSNEDLRPDKGERIPVYLGIKVEEVEFHKYSDRLRVKGIIVHGPDEVARGEYHTINVEVGTNLRIIKDEWPTYMLDRLNEASKGAEESVLIIAVEEGSAFISLVDRFTVTHLVRINENIPGKRSEDEREQSLRRFYSKIAKSISQFTKQFKPLKIIMAGPGLTKNYLKDYVSANFPELGRLIILENASYGDENGIYEVIRKGAIEKVISESIALREMEAVEELLAQLAKNPEKVAYGDEQVEKAITYGAVYKLLITAKKIREATPDQRKKIEELIKLTEKFGGKILIVNEEHMAGQQLSSLGGIAALLRYHLSE